MRRGSRGSWGVGLRIDGRLGGEADLSVKDVDAEMVGREDAGWSSCSSSSHDMLSHEMRKG